MLEPPPVVLVDGLLLPVVTVGVVDLAVVAVDVGVDPVVGIDSDPALAVNLKVIF